MDAGGYEADVAGQAGHVEDVDDVVGHYLVFGCVSVDFAMVGERTAMDGLMGTYVCARELLPSLDGGAGECALPHAVEKEATPALLAGCMVYNEILEDFSLMDVEVIGRSGPSMEEPKGVQLHVLYANWA